MNTKLFQFLPGHIGRLHFSSSTVSRWHHMSSSGQWYPCGCDVGHFLIWLLKCPVGFCMLCLSHHLMAGCGRLQDPIGLWDERSRVPESPYGSPHTKYSIRGEKKMLCCVVLITEIELFVTTLSYPD